MLLAKIGGFFVVPMAGAVATRLLTKPDETVETQAYKGAAAHALVALAAYYGSKQPLPADVAHFLRGGMWGSGVGAVYLAAAPTVAPEMAKQLLNPRVSPTAQLSAAATSGNGKGSDTLRSTVKLLTAS